MTNLVDQAPEACESYEPIACQRCGSSIPKGEDREYFGKILCEDCYMDAISPTRTCDPWAVHSAKSFGDATGGGVLTPRQTKIIDVLRATGGAEPSALAERIGIPLTEMEREIATLRHMEKIRAELRSGRKFIILW